MAVTGAFDTRPGRCARLSRRHQAAGVQPEGPPRCGPGVPGGVRRAASAGGALAARGRRDVVGGIKPTRRASGLPLVPPRPALGRPEVLRQWSPRALVEAAPDQCLRIRMASGPGRCGGVAPAAQGRSYPTAAWGSRGSRAEPTRAFANAQDPSRSERLVPPGAPVAVMGAGFAPCSSEVAHRGSASGLGSRHDYDLVSFPHAEEALISASVACAGAGSLPLRPAVYACRQP